MAWLSLTPEADTLLALTQPQLKLTRNPLPLTATSGHTDENRLTMKTKMTIPAPPPVDNEHVAPGCELFSSCPPPKNRPEIIQAGQYVYWGDYRIQVTYAKGGEAIKGAEKLATVLRSASQQPTP